MATNKLSYVAVLSAIHDLMVQLRQLKNAARLRVLTDLYAIKSNVPRWSSKYEMAKKNIWIESEIKKIPKVEDYDISSRDRRTLGELMVHLFKFQSVTKSLQKKGLSTFLVREVFDSTLDRSEYPDTETYLAARADIVNNPNFESGLNKILEKCIVLWHPMKELQLLACYGTKRFGQNHMKFKMMKLTLCRISKYYKQRSGVG